MKSDIIDKDEDEYERIIKCYQRAKEKRYIKPPLSEIIKGMTLIRGKDFEKNNIKKNNINVNNNRFNRNNTNIRTNNNFRNNRNQNRYNNQNNLNRSTVNENNNRRRKNNFNSHFVDLDEFLGD